MKFYKGIKGKHRLLHIFDGTVKVKLVICTPDIRISEILSLVIFFLKILPRMTCGFGTLAVLQSMYIFDK